MKYLATIFLAASSSAAMAHPGHLGESAGHDHWLAAAALIAALAIGGAAIWRGRRKRAMADRNTQKQEA